MSDKAPSRQSVVVPDFERYRRSQIAELRPFVDGEVLSVRVSISQSDFEAGHPMPGDMIARNPANHDDQWLVAADYFAANFEPAAPAPSSLAGGEVSMGRRAFEAMRNANRPRDHREWSDLTDDQRNAWNDDAAERPHLYGLAALSPEAPAREVFLDLFIAWHTMPGEDFQIRFPAFRERLWQAGLTSPEGSKAEWLAVAEEFAK